MESSPAGSVFELLLTLAAATLPRHKAPGHAAITVSGHVLVVDDNASSRRILANNLMSAGLHPVVCDSAAQALHLPQTLDAHYALIDVGLPDIDGYALVTELRKKRSSAQMTIIMMGALSSDAERAKTLRSGSNGSANRRWVGTMPQRPSVCWALTTGCQGLGWAH